MGRLAIQYISIGHEDNEVKTYVSRDKVYGSFRSNVKLNRQILVMVEDNWRIGYKKSHSGPRGLVTQPLSQIIIKKLKMGQQQTRVFGLHIIYSLFVLLSFRIFIKLKKKKLLTNIFMT